MGVFTTNRTTNRVIVALVILNLALLATTWYSRLSAPGKETSPPTRAVPKENGYDRGNKRESARRQGLIRFLERELGFTRDQIDQFMRLRDEHFRESKAIKRQIDDLRKEMMDQLPAEKPDIARVEKLATAMGEKMAEHEKAVFNHFLDLMTICSEEQVPKYRALLRDILERLIPGGERRPGNLPPRRRQDGNGYDGGPPARPGGDGSGQPDSRRPPRREGDAVSTDSPEERYERRPARETMGFPSRDSRPGKFGQGPPGPPPGEGGDENRLERLRNELELDDSQVEKIRPILEKSRQQLRQIPRDSRYLSREERRQARDKILQQEDEQLETLLTPAQKERYRQIKKRRGGPPDTRGRSPGNSP